MATHSGILYDACAAFLPRLIFTTPGSSFTSFLIDSPLNFN
jgi:hypothetical protein